MSTTSGHDHSIQSATVFALSIHEGCHCLGMDELLVKDPAENGLNASAGHHQVNHAILVVISALNRLLIASQAVQSSCWMLCQRFSSQGNRRSAGSKRAHAGVPSSSIPPPQHREHVNHVIMTRSAQWTFKRTSIRARTRKVPRRLLFLVLAVLLTGLCIVQLAFHWSTVRETNIQQRTTDDLKAELDLKKAFNIEEAELSHQPQSTQPLNDVQVEIVGTNQYQRDAQWKPKQFDYRQIFSLTTRDRKFFPIFFGQSTAYNPNIIPHPTDHEMWIVVAQHEQTDQQIQTSEQLSCAAGFLNGVLVCSKEPSVILITPSRPGKCEGEQAYFNFRAGPRDARMFYGPDAPYIVYGSQSAHTCLGLWLHDARMLLDPFRLERHVLVKLFKQSTEIQRTAPIHAIEKNFFLFWDSNGKAYAHYDLWPERSFAVIDADGSVVGENLGPAAADNDEICMARYMPEVGPKQESIHQATNTLSITLGRRTDPGCHPSDKNTFIMHIFHHKTYYDFHGVYEPFVILFKQTEPFEIYGISTRPIWIHGRTKLSKMTGSLQYKGREEWIPEGHTEMFYLTSMSWKSHGQKYHGYMDDVVLLTFGIEDTRAGALDVLAADLVQDLGLC